MKYLIYLLFAACWLPTVVLAQTDKAALTKDVKLSADEQQLYDAIMEYRTALKLPLIPLSRSLTYVAQQHCRDLVNNHPDLTSGCNAHSWSAKGNWSSCCYTADGQKAACMWNKPKEMTSYPGNGYEIACGSSDPLYKDFVMTPDYALSTWKKSYYHNITMTNKDMWKDLSWKAIGIGIYKGFATVWFGSETDPAGAPAK